MTLFYGPKPLVPLATRLTCRQQRINRWRCGRWKVNTMASLETESWYSADSRLRPANERYDMWYDANVVVNVAPEVVIMKIMVSLVTPNLTPWRILQNDSTIPVWTCLMIYAHISIYMSVKYTLFVFLMGPAQIDVRTGYWLQSPIYWSTDLPQLTSKNKKIQADAVTTSRSGFPPGTMPRVRLHFIMMRWVKILKKSRKTGDFCHSSQWQ